MHEGDPGLTQPVQKPVGMIPGFGIGNADSAADHQRNENIAQADIECRRRQQTDPQVWSQAEFPDFPVDEMAQSLMTS